MSGIYIHIPFCKKKCHYCDFYSITDFSYEDMFVNSLLREIELTENKLEHIETIFIGGGTPSILSIKNINRIINALNKKFALSEMIEFSIEANPGTLYPELLTNYYQVGINRLSIGVQSLIPEELTFLQRIHSADEAINNIITAREIGFDNINADLIFSIPGQSQENIIYNIDTLINSGVKHLSCYSLIYEEDTPLYKDLIENKILKTDEDVELSQYLEIISHLTTQGFNQYEISNFSIPGYECLHNLNYWRRKQYLGFGPSAHSFISGKRYVNSANIKEYIHKLTNNQLPIIDTEIIDDEKSISEIVYLGLRAEGLNLETLKPFISAKSLLNIIDYARKIARDNYLIFNNDILKFTAKGYTMCDHITVKIMERAVAL